MGSVRDRHKGAHVHACIILLAEILKDIKCIHSIEQMLTMQHLAVSSLTLPCFHLHLRWRGAASRPARGQELRGADLCSQNSPAGPEEPSTGSHPPLAGR